MFKKAVKCLNCNKLAAMLSQLRVKLNKLLSASLRMLNWKKKFKKAKK